VVTSTAIALFSLPISAGNPLVASAITLFGSGRYLGLMLPVFFGRPGFSLRAGVRDTDLWLFYGPPAGRTTVKIVTPCWNCWLLITACDPDQSRSASLQSQSWHFQPVTNAIADGM
jgi:hypothetical protein